ncbi:MAG: adenosylcobinamide-GDP ribazoletransferase [Synechococcus sp.]
MAAAPAWLRDLAGAWVFYSVLPAWPRLQPGFQRIARFAPWIGLVIAALQIGVWSLLQGLGWPPLATVPMVIAMAAWVTGGLHLDGVMDTADGLAAGVSRRLEAMEDSRVGASGVQALMVVLLLQVAALVCLAERLPMGMPMVLATVGCFSRCSPLWAVLRFPYLRKDGTAGFHREGARGWREIRPSLLVILLAAVVAAVVGQGVLLGLMGLVGLLSGVGVAEGLGRCLGGHTGDSYGACVVWTETLSLVLLALIHPLLAWAAG